MTSHKTNVWHHLYKN